MPPEVAVAMRYYQLLIGYAPGDSPPIDQPTAVYLANAGARAWRRARAR